MVCRSQALRVGEVTDEQAVEQITNGLNRMIRPLVRAAVPVRLILRALRDMADSLEEAERRTFN